MNEKQLRIVAIAGSLISLVFIYVFVSSISPGNVNIGAVTANHAGKDVNLTGTISRMTVKDGNAFLSLKDGTGEIRVVIWERIMQQLEKNGFDTSSLREGVKISIVGEVDVYRGQLEIVPSSPEITIIEKPA